MLVQFDQAGIDTRPIRALSGESEFNEVSFSGATTPIDHVIGEVNGGWAVASTLLELERGEEVRHQPDSLPCRARPAHRDGHSSEPER